MRMSVRLVLVAVSLLSAPLAAQQPVPAPLPDLSGMSIQQLGDLLRSSGDRWSVEPCAFSVPVTQALLDHDGEEPQFRRLNLIAQSMCADVERRYADGLQLTQQINGLQSPRLTVDYALYFAWRLDDVDTTLAILRGVEGEEFAQISRDAFWRTSNLFREKGRQAELEAVALAWAERGGLRYLDDPARSPVAVAALRAAAKTGRAENADMLLQAISDPQTYIRLLTERDYEPFWPQIEARAGRNLSRVGAEHVRITGERLAAAPEDRDRFSDAAHALHFNGEFAQAIELARRWQARAERGAAIEEGDAWALNIQAYAHDSLGQTGSADAVFEQLAAVDPDQHDWVVNFVINRASRLVGQGRWSEGLAATELARTVAETQGTVYAKAIIASDRACALQKLGRAEEAAVELAYLRENWRDAVGSAVGGLLCHDHREEAAGLLLQGLRDDRLRDLALSALTPPDLDLFYSASILPTAQSLLDDHPELATELARHVRPIPQAYIPQASLRRIRVPLPTW